ncbi:hypothetical protein ACFV0C_29185 [Streptomyces sp. NPDC059568]|uniref:hypothetical protein n=1 Tax=Streptomyces sp. NPDC059568 TaxID=3346868 RepID=UPI003688D167
MSNMSKCSSGTGQNTRRPERSVIAFVSSSREAEIDYPLRVLGPFFLQLGQPVGEGQQNMAGEKARRVVIA